MGERRSTLDTDYMRDLIELTARVHEHGYRWEKSEKHDSESLKEYVDLGKLSKLLGNWWGCSIANLYFYDRSETETEAQIRWFHETVDEGMDLPWLRILGQRTNKTFEYDSILGEQNKELRAEQRQLLKQGPFAPKVIFGMFADEEFRRSLSERADGWILVSLGEILTYAFEWYLRKEAIKIHRSQPLEDLSEYFSTDHTDVLLTIWNYLMEKIGDAQKPEDYFDGIMLSWINGVMENEEEYQNWWVKKDGNYDWFIDLARKTNGKAKLQELISLPDFHQRLIRFSQILMRSWDYGFLDGADHNWEQFADRLRFSPPLEVERFGTRNLVSFPTWLQWLHNGGRMISTNAAFVFAGFYDTEIAKRYARDIQIFFTLLTQPDIAKHTIPKLMLAKAGILAEATTYELRQPLSSSTSIVDTLSEKLGQGQELSTMYLDTKLQDLRRSLELIERISNDLLYLPAQGSVKLTTTSVNVNQLLEEALDTCSLATSDNVEGIFVEKELQANLPAVQGSEDRLRHAFLEIIINAKEAMHNRRKKSIRVSTEEHSGNIVILISDTGKGIDERTLSRIFDPFFSTKEPKGIGLGLFNAKRIVDLHKGEVAVRSAPDEGTEIRILLPIR